MIIDLHVRLEDVANIESLDRLDIIDWDEIHDAIQPHLDDLASTLRKPGASPVVSKSGRNRGGSWRLFSYRTFYPPQERHVDPVVAGITIESGLDESFVVRGDICGEESGDMLFETASRKIIGKPALMEACRDIARSLAAQHKRVQDALSDPRRTVRN